MTHPYSFRPTPPPPKRYPLPLEPGVYLARREVALHNTGELQLLEMQVQLGPDGQWWPHPFSFSGWRMGELELFTMESLPALELDIPEIPNPEFRAAVEELTLSAQEHFGSDRATAAAFARKRLLASEEV